MIPLIRERFLKIFRKQESSNPHNNTDSDNKLWSGFEILEFLNGISIEKRITGFLFLLFLVGLGLHQGLRYFSRGTEALLLLATLSILAGCKPLVEKFLAIDPTYKFVVIGLLILLLIGQLARKNTFPFVPWMMYGDIRNEEYAPCYEYLGKSQNGKAERFEPAWTLPTLANFGVDVRLRDQIQRIQAETDPGRRDVLMKHHEATLVALARLQNHEQPENPIVTIEVSQCTIPLNTYKDDTSIKRWLLWEVNMKGG